MSPSNKRSKGTARDHKGKNRSARQKRRRNPVGRLVLWIARNKYKHIEAGFADLLRDDAVDARLRKDLRRRLKAAKRMYVVRAFLFVLIFMAGIGSFLAALFEAATQDPALGFLARVVFLLVIPALASVSVLLLAIVNRSLGIAEAELYVFGMRATVQHMGKAG